MSRFSRKDRKDIEYKGCGGLTDAFDNAFKQAWYINDEEFDYINDETSNEELDAIIEADISLSHKRIALAIVDKYILELNSLDE